MRTNLTLAAALAALAVAAAPAPALPVTCPDPCTVQATNAGYAPPLASLANGQLVTWQSLDQTHPTAEAFADEPCFVASTAAGVPSPPVAFELASGVLTATVDPGAPGQVTKTCTQAQGLGDGSVLLVYRCLLHPHMWASLVVNP